MVGRIYPADIVGKKCNLDQRQQQGYGSDTKQEDRCVYQDLFSCGSYRKLF